MLRHQAALELEAFGQLGVERAGHQGLHGAVGRSAAGSQRGRQLLHRGSHRPGRDHAIDEAPGERLRRGEPPAEQHQLLGPPRADEPRQPLAPTPARHQPEVRVLIPEPRGLVGHH
ncbi:MAG TPA: hypothetical protein VK547_04640, partial [Candidatus Udaeobacter sp.]|nr:hypothetical protein [Candidatus Udaeobacter sp.]